MTMGQNSKRTAGGLDFSESEGLRQGRRSGTAQFRICPLLTTREQSTISVSFPSFTVWHFSIQNSIAHETSVLLPKERKKNIIKTTRLLHS